MICVALLLSMLTTSCKEFLDIEPIDSLTPEKALETYQEYNAALLSAYNTLTTAGYYGGDFIALADITADNIKYGPNVVGFYQTLYELNYTANNAEFLNLFRQPYQAIYRANNIMELLPSSKLTEVEKNQIRGECLMIRALAHHDLVRIFAGRYDATPDASHLGVTIKTTTSLSSLPRNTVKEVYNQIMADINEALPILPTTFRTIISPGEPIHFTRNAANALKARVALYMRDWATAEAAATASITSGPSLSTGSTYTNMWRKPEAYGEVIFKLKMAAGVAAVLGTNFWNAVGNVARYIPVNDLVDSYDASDIRLSAFYRPHPNVSNIFVPLKYEGDPGNTGLVDVKIFRTSEMYLIRAEARLKKGTPDEIGSLADINAVRSARGIATISVSGSGLITALRDEKRKEFFLEGHRWFDIAREGLSVNRFDFNSNVGVLNAGNFRFVFPVPQNELLANALMVQNPGY